MKIGHPKDFASGMMFITIGAMFALVAKGLTIGDWVILQGYAMGTPARMGPAFFPFWLGILQIAFGAWIAILALRSEGGEDSALPRFHWRPILYVLGAVVGFGIILRPLGMLLSGFLLVLVASYGNPEKFHARGTLLLAVGLVIFCALVFVWGLSLPIPMCPDVEAIQSTIPFCRF